VQAELAAPERLVTKGIEPEGLSALLDHLSGVGEDRPVEMV
jgi:hypothetical protein